MDYKSWVRGCSNIKLNLSSKVAKLSGKSSEMIDEWDYFLGWSFEDVANLVNSLFGDEKKAIAALGEMGYQGLLYEVCSIIMDHSFEEMNDYWEKMCTGEKAKLHDFVITLSIMPSIIETKSLGTDRTQKNFTPFFLLDCGNTKTSLKGLYSKGLSFSLIDTSGEKVGISQFAHEFSHYYVQGLRDAGLDEFMYDDGPNRREEIIVHALTDDFCLFQAVHELAKCMTITRDDKTGEAKKMYTKKCSVQRGLAENGFDDKIVKGNDVLIFDGKNCLAQIEMSWLSSLNDARSELSVLREEVRSSTSKAQRISIIESWFKNSKIIKDPTFRGVALTKLKFVQAKK